MSGKNKNKSWPIGLTPEQRIEKAGKITSKLVDHILHLQALHASNQHVLFSEEIARHIPRSYAAHAFNLLQDTCYRYEVLRICAIWDNPTAERESILTVYELIKDSDVLERLNQKIVLDTAYRGDAESISNPDDDPNTQQKVRQHMDKIHHENARNMAEVQNEKLCLALREIADIQIDQRLQSLKNARNHHIAHSLRLNVPVNVDSYPKVGDEAWLLEKSIKIVDILHQCLNGAGFAFHASKDFSQRNAASFWNGIIINVID